jgi:phosphatidate cytidylyltransferase
VAANRGGSDLAGRVLVAVIAIPVAVFLVLQGGEVFAFGLAVLGVIALGELYTLMERVRPPALAGFLTLVAMLAAALYGEPRHVVMVLVAAFPVTFFLALLRPRRANVSWAIAVTLFGVLWIGLAMVHAIWLRDLSIEQDGETIEGLVGGIVGGTLAFWCAGLYQDWLSGWDALLIGFLVAIAAPLGDLFESLVKRDLEVKDTGTLFGAHGGVLDRLDAVMFTVVVGYYAAVALGYG